MNQRPSLNRRLRLVLLFGLFLTVAFTVSTSGTGSAPILVATSTVAKPGEEVVGTGITYGNSGVYFSAFWRPGNDEAEALVGKFAAPMPDGALPAWSRGWPGGAGFDAFMGADVGADGVYYAGASYSQTSDSVGGKERKEIVAKFNLDGTAGADTGGAAWVGRQRFYPGSNGYDGDEFFNTARVSVEGGTTYFYGAGRAQSNGCNSTYAIRKYTASGATSWQWQQTNGACGGSEFNAIVVNGSDVYAAGSSSYAGNLPQILQFSASSGSAGPSATFSGTLDGYLSGTYTSMAVHGGNIYAAGYLTSGERQAYLLDEWNTSGTRLVHRVWSSDATKANSQQLTGITAVGSRLFVTGWTRDLDNPATAHNMGGPTTPVFLDNSAYHGFGDGVIFEINPSNGDVVSTTTYGMNDAKDQAFTGVTTDGTDLYVVGGERDATGFYHVIVQRYGLSVATTLVNVSASGSYGGQATLQATLSSSGAPISGATVNFTVSGNPAGSAVTDANGLAQVTNVSLAGVNAGGYPGVVGATFTATGNFLGSSATGDLTVNKAGAAISVTVPGTSLVSGQLHAPYNGQAHPAVGAVRGVLVPTDSLGAATITYTDLDTTATSPSAPVNAGSYRVNASFAGNTNYVSGSNNSVTFTIDQASTSTALQTWSPFAPTGTGPAFGSYGSAEFNDGAGHVIVVSADSSNPFVLSAGSGLGGTPSWTSPTASGSHPVQKNAAAAYDPASNSVMMYGGCSSGCTPITNQVWVLSNANGVGGTPTWINRTPASSPAPRQAMARGYDPTSNRLIIFGGQDGGGSGGSTYPDVWVLTNANGTGGSSTWTQLTPDNAPAPGQWGPSSWYDSASNRLIVAGGGAQFSGTLTRAVWALTNANGLGGTPHWINLIPEGAAGSPNGFVLWPAAYDAATNRAMLFETGTSNIWVITNANGLGGTPTYNHVTLTGGPSSLTDNVEMAYDAVNHRLTVIPSASQIFVLGSADGTGSINPSIYGQPVTFTATVSPIAPATGTRTGTVTFKDGATALGTAAVNAAGQAVFTTTSLSATGTPHAITAVYSGDTNFTTSTSSPQSHTVNGTSTTTTLSSSPNPSTFAQSVTFTATVTGSGGTPSGTVDFKEGATTLGTGALSGGVATLVTSSLSLGSHSITAVYGGDTTFITSTSSALSHTVNPAPAPTASFTAIPNPAACGQMLTFDGSGSSASSGLNIASYAWNFGDGATGTGSTTTHAYSAFGSYNATLTVTDNNVPAKTGSKTTVVNVNQGNQAPTANAGGPYVGNLGSSLALNGSGSSDPNASCGDVITYAWTIGGTITATGPTPSLSAAQINSLGVGSHTVSLTVTDIFGATSTATTTLTLQRVLVSIAVTPASPSVAPGQTQQFTATGTYSDASTQLLSGTGGTWAASGSLVTARIYHTATRLQDGSVLVVGGYNGTTTFASAERYYPATGTWVSAGSMATARNSHTATLLPNGTVLVVGGILYTGPAGTLFSSTELYDPATNTWTAGAPLTLGNRSSHSAVLLGNGKVLVVAGLQSYPDCAYRSTAELYNPATGTWAATGSLHLARSSASTTLLANGKVLLAAGPANNCPTPNNGMNQAEIYDPVTGAWTVTGNLSLSRYANSIATLPSGKVLLAGGYSVGGPTATADLYDPSTGTFALTGSLATARVASVGSGDNGTGPVLQSGKVLFAGGSTTSGTILGSAELYDPTSGTWSTTGSLTTPRTYNTATLLQDGRVLVVGGSGTGSFSLASAELYTPPAVVSWASSNGSAATITQTGLATGVSSGTSTITATSSGISGSNLSGRVTYDSVIPDRPTFEKIDKSNLQGGADRLAIGRLVDQ